MEAVAVLVAAYAITGCTIAVLMALWDMYDPEDVRYLVVFTIVAWSLLIAIFLSDTFGRWK